jgi:hypothetical protein
MKADGLWSWDDNNQTTLPIGTTALVAGQQDYEITAADFLNVREVAVLDANGKYRVLTAVDRSKGVAQQLEDLEGGDAGLPVKYDKVGNSIMLYPKPGAGKVTLAAGLKVYFQRIPSYFTASDTTKTPGFNPLYHRVLSLAAAIDYCIAKGLSKKQVALEREYQKLNEQMMAHYASRSKDEQATLQLQGDDYGGSDAGSRSSSQFTLY